MTLQLQLSFPEAERLTELEAVIDRGRQTFIEVGQALLEIRDARLYRADFGTFEDYCLERWGFSRFTAYDLIKTSEVVQLVEEVQQTAPTREQARELAPLRSHPETLRQVWEQANDNSNGSPTTQDIRLAAFQQTQDLEQRSSNLGVHFSSATDDWSTPQDLFDQLNAEFGFDLDVCATAENTKCGAFFDRELDGLSQAWTGTCWMNPPYGDAIGKWVAKADDAGAAGALVVCLLPARTDTNWWWDHARYGEVRFLKGRLKFGGAESSAPFPSCVVIFGRPASVKWWER